MAQLREAIPTYAEREARTDQEKPAPNQEPAAITKKADNLTFITSDGEVIVFEGMNVPLAEETAHASEETLGKIWNRPAEDAAWRDL